MSRIGDTGWDNTSPALVDGVFLAPYGYTRAHQGPKALVNGEEFALRGVPSPHPPLLDVASKQEAVEWAKRVPSVTGSKIEIRRVAGDDETPYDSEAAVEERRI